MNLAIYISAILLFGFGFSQPKKDDRAHIFASMSVHSTSYMTLNVLFDGKGKNWLPFVAVEVVGAWKEVDDAKKPHNEFSMKDMMYNNLGALLSFFMIKGLEAFGVDENVAAGIVLTGGIAGLGVTVNF